MRHRNDQATSTPKASRSIRQVFGSTGVARDQVRRHSLTCRKCAVGDRLSLAENLISKSLTVCAVRTKGLTPELLPRIAPIIECLITKTLVSITLTAKCLVSKRLPRVASVVEGLVAETLEALPVATKGLIPKLLTVDLGVC